METLLALLPIIGALTFGGLLGHEVGKKRGYKLGHFEGWQSRHEDATEAEREAWRERTRAEQLELMAATGTLNRFKPANGTDVRDSRDSV